MSENDVRDAYLALFGKQGDDPSLVDDLRPLRDRARQNGLETWCRIIDARIARAEHRFDEAAGILEDVLSREPENPHALFYHAVVNSWQPERREAAVAEYCKLIDLLKPSDDPATDQIVAAAMANKGVTLGELDRHEEALSACEELVTRFGKAEEPALRVSVANAMVSRGCAFAQLDRGKEALSACEEVITRFGEAEELALQDQVARAMFNKGAILDQLDRDEEALSAYEEVVTRFAGAEELALQERVAKAMGNKPVALGRLDRLEEALSACEEIVTRFGEAEELALREQVAMAMVNKGVALGRLDRHEEALSADEEVVTRFGEAEELALREQVAKAMVNKGVALGRLDRHEEALSAYEEVVTRFGEAEDGEIPSLVAWVANRRSALLRRLNRPEAPEARRDAAERSENKYSDQLRIYLDYVLAQFDKPTLDGYFKMMAESEKRMETFLTDDSRFDADASFLLVLREWNSFTPALPAEGESDRGGGYFLRHEGEGVVIDPGYDFLENFARAGGRIRDIDHIVVTHAHDDHTAELESLLMLLYRLGRDESRAKRVCLYLSQGCQRKFSGIVPLRDARHIKRVVTLSRPAPGSSQLVRLSDSIELTVLPAYHDDVVTRETAVGVAFSIDIQKQKPRRIVFTGDTGYYPPLLDDNNKLQYYDKEKERPQLDTAQDKGLFHQYPKVAHRADLLVAHIGSIKPWEFESVKSLKDTERKEGEWYYANHLGMLGTLRLMDEMRPRVAVISEFGAELRGFHIELVAGIAQALHDKQDDKSKGKKRKPTRTFVYPGDVTLVYYLDTGKFLCHEDCEPHAPKDLTCHRLNTWLVAPRPGGGATNVTCNEDETRAHLCHAPELKEVDERQIHRYYDNLYEAAL